MSPTDAVIVALGALSGGFVSGLAGFGTAMTTMGIWLHVLDPATAATLTLICSVVAQAQTIPSVWASVVPSRVLPIVIPGILGVPLGLAALGYVDANEFKFGAGVFLIAFAGFMLLWRDHSPVAWGGRAADAVMGLVAGVLGGLAGLSGALPTMWAHVRGWGKAEKRGVFQVFNLTILAFAFLVHAATGRVTSALLIPAAVALPATLLGARLGLRAYHGLNERNFSDLVMALLVLSGLMLVIPQL